MSKHHPTTSAWRNIRLELEPTAGFPQGSASRAYLLSLPLREDGTVDEAAVQANPQMARFKRFWPSEPDRTGSVTRNGEMWILSFRTTRESADTSFQIVMPRLLPGDHATIGEPDGNQWRFRVIGLEKGMPAIA
ncbi:hypothetical protein [Novosphingobium sp.]|uniref:hypothetical protein n=1 Tax=Novosphingobium sp. TaxID=1874826 RepID=UPI002B47DE7F|nr:hypothetical protein [Novosphingobium sp.]HKR90662.1 hypothetical protein [Novosphingobium sp.]